MLIVFESDFADLRISNNIVTKCVCTFFGRLSFESIEECAREAKTTREQQKRPKKKNAWLLPPLLLLLASNEFLNISKHSRRQCAKTCCDRFRWSECMEICVIHLFWSVLRSATNTDARPSRIGLSQTGWATNPLHGTLVCIAYTHSIATI